MRRLLDLGRKAMFYVRVLSGYEERRIRNYRLQLEQRLQKAQERKAALRKIPEQAIISEVRRMVEEMQNLNKKLEETEAAIDEYFKPIDKEVNKLMEIKHEGEKSTTEEMLATMQQQALMEKAEAERLARARAADSGQKNQDEASSPREQAQVQ